MTVAHASGTPPLGGIRVVEFGQLIGAPNAAMILAELGADVVTVEPLAGDAGRELQTAAFAGSSTIPTFLAFNRNKRSIALDLKHADARSIALELIAGADVVIESSRPGAVRTRTSSTRRCRVSAIRGPSTTDAVSTWSSRPRAA